MNWLGGAGWLVVQVRQNVLDMTLHIAQYSSIIAALRDEIRRLRQKLGEQSPHKHAGNAASRVHELIHQERSANDRQMTTDRTLSEWVSRV